MNWRTIVLATSVILLSLSMTACVIVSTAPTPSASTDATSDASAVAGSSGGETYCILSPDGAGFSSRGGTLEPISNGASTQDPSLLQNAGEGAGSILHGKMVWSTLQDELGRLHAAPVTTEQAQSGIGDLVVLLVPDEFSFLDEPRVHRQELWSAPGVGDVLLVALDIKDFKVNEATSLISTTLASYQSGSSMTITDGVEITLPAATKFVINMSWIEVPCSKVPTDKKGYLALLCDTVNSADDKALSDLITFKKMTNGFVGASFKEFCASNKPEVRATVPYTALESFIADPTVGRLILKSTYETNTLSAVINNDSSQPLNEALNCTSQNGISSPDCETPSANMAMTPDVSVINIAAAGNSSLPYPFAPALFDSVISVSSSDAVTTFETITSTVVITDSSNPITRPMYSNWGEVAMPGLHPDGVHMGSSFAAPRLSVWAALYLLHGGKSPCEAHTDIPVLGYKGGIRNSAPMRNLELDAAIQQYCDSSPFQ